jgi:PmbA protein
MPKDENRALPEPQKSYDPPNTFLSSLFDTSMFAAPLRDWEPRLLEMQSCALKADPRIKKVLHLGYGESRAEVAIANTLGVRAFERGTSGSIGLTTVAESTGEVQVGSASQCARLAQDLDLARIVQEAVFRSVSLLDSKKLPSRRRAVLFDPWIAGEILELFVAALSAEAVQRGKSLLRGKLGALVASPNVSLSDNPRRAGGVASSSYDDEGLPTQDKRMVERGVLKGYFYDAYTARQEGIVSNGCAGRPSFKGLPGPSSSNFYMEPGAISRDQLIRDTQDGILAIDVMGMHTADPVSGEFSVGISGVAVEKGQLGHGVRGAMVSGNILDLLAQVDAVAQDLIFYGSLATPTFRVADLMVA